MFLRDSRLKQYLPCCLNLFRKWKLSYEGVRVINVDNSIFIHDVIPRHVETVVLLCRNHIDAEKQISVTIETEDGRQADKPVKATYSQIKGLGIKT